MRDIRRGTRLAAALLVVAGLALVALCGCPPAAGPPSPPAAQSSPQLSASRTLPVEVYFSPEGGCTDAVVRTLNNAQQSVRVQAYSFTSAPIAKALVQAARRGVQVEVILDKSQRTEHYSSADFLSRAGIPTYIDAAHAIAHNKVMIVDGETVITGSFNFTKAAEYRNAENLLIIRDRSVAARYLENWQRHRAHSEAYVPARGARGSTGATGKTRQR